MVTINSNASASGLYFYVYDYNGNSVTFDSTSTSEYSIVLSFGVYSDYTYYLSFRYINDYSYRAFPVEISFEPAGPSVIEGSTSMDSTAPLLDTGTYTISVTGTNKYFRLYPSYSGTMTIYSQATEDTYITVYNAYGDTITYDDDSGNNGQFRVTFSVSSYTTYYIAPRLYSGSTPTEVTIVISME